MSALQINQTPQLFFFDNASPCSSERASTPDRWQCFASWLCMPKTCSQSKVKRPATAMRRALILDERLCRARFIILGQEITSRSLHLAIMLAQVTEKLNMETFFTFQTLLIKPLWQKDAILNTPTMQVVGPFGLSVFFSSVFPFFSPAWHFA